MGQGLSLPKVRETVYRDIGGELVVPLSVDEVGKTSLIRCRVEKSLACRLFPHLPGDKIRSSGGSHADSDADVYVCVKVIAASQRVEENEYNLRPQLFNPTSLGKNPASDTVGVDEYLNELVRSHLMRASRNTSAKQDYPSYVASVCQEYMRASALNGVQRELVLMESRDPEDESVRTYSILPSFILGFLSRLYVCPGIVSVPSEVRPCGPPKADDKPMPRWQPYHANLPDIYQVAQSGGESPLAYVFFDVPDLDLETAVKYRKRMLRQSDIRARFLVYQLIHVIEYVHRQGIVHGSLRPSHILLTDNLWAYLTGFDSPAVPRPLQHDTVGTYNKRLGNLVRRWLCHEVTNYDYLMELNSMAGRKVGNCRFHPVMPWVVDFSYPNGYLRDLSKTKFRLKKGDFQLDFTYTSPQPHHITESLSEVTYYIYMSRRTPIDVLRTHVRENFEPNEYPSNMQRMYEWTPDECIPEFFSDPKIFRSIHGDMVDLAVPEWCEGPEDFILKHRAILESDEVSQALHNWIDLTFGYKLNGAAAVEAKNVSLANSDGYSGFVQLFEKPHPRRRPLPRDERPVSTRLEDVPFIIPARRESEASQKDSYRNSIGSYVEVDRDTIPAELNQSANSEKRDILSPHNLKDVAKATTQELQRNFKTARNNIKKYGLLKGLDEFGKEAERQRMKGGRSNQQYQPSNQTPTSISRQNSRGQAEKGMIMSELVEGLNSYEQEEDFIAHCGEVAACYESPRINDASLSGVSIRQYNCSADMFSLGCTIAEIFLLRPLFNARSMAHYINGTRAPNLDGLPSNIRPLVSSLIGLDFSRRPPAGALLNHGVFPPYFQSCHEFLSHYHFDHNWSRRLDLTISWVSKWNGMPTEMFEIIIPFILPFFHLPEVRVSSLPLLDPISMLFGVEMCKKYFLSSIIAMYNMSDDLALQASLLNFNFVQSLLRILGQNTTIDHIFPHILSALRTKDENISQSASKSLILLTYNIGSDVTIHHIALPLLGQLGRSHMSAAVATLVGIGMRLGEGAVIQYYLPRIDSLLQNLVKSEDLGSDGVLMDGLCLLEGLLSVLSPTTTLRECVIESSHIFNLLLSPSPNSHILNKVASILVRVSRRIGAEKTKQYVLIYLDDFFFKYRSYYDKQGVVIENTSTSPSNNADDLISTYRARSYSESKGRTIYTPELAHDLYAQLCPLVGRQVMRKSIRESELIEKILENYRLVVDGEPLSPGDDPMSLFGSDGTIRERGDGGQRQEAGDGSSGLKERQQVAPISDKWLFSAMVRNSVKAHSSSIRAMDVHPENENVFVTGGKDCLIRCWAVDEIKCLNTYYGHREPIQSVRMLDGGNRVSSSDGASVHVWDSETSRRLCFFDYGAPYTALAPVPAKSLLITGCDDLSIRFLDTSSGQSLCKWRVSTATLGHIRCIACYGDHPRVAVGFSSGIVNMFDQRTGILMDSWKAHSADITKMEWSEGGSFLITSSVDKTMALWKPGGGAPAPFRVFRGNAEIISAFTTYRKDLLAASGNKIGVASLYDDGDTNQQLAFNYLKQRHAPGTTKSNDMQKVKVNINTMSVLAHYKVILVGGEDGFIRICQ